MAMILTVLAAELTTSEIVLGIAGSSVFAALVTGLIAYLASRSKNNAEARSTDAKTISGLIGQFREVLNEVVQAKHEAISAEERHSLDRIASTREIAGLRAQVEKCDEEHQEWAECRMNMLQFLVKIEPELQASTNQPTLLGAVQSLRSQIEET